MKLNNLAKTVLTDPPKPVRRFQIEELNLFQVTSTESSKLRPISKSLVLMTGICWTSYVVCVQGLSQSEDPKGWSARTGK